MREIKFRGKRVDNGEWVYGDLGFDGFRRPYIHNLDDGEQCFSVIPETVGQFTGLRDKNGREIYEGDIVDLGPLGDADVTMGTVIIEWSDKEAGFMLRPLKIRHEGVDGQWTGWSIENWEVIGNIYENPELVEP
jgi:uncharacterized phage protein (TIGR01671 family)